MFVPRLLNALDRALTNATGRYEGVDEDEGGEFEVEGKPSDMKGEATKELGSGPESSPSSFTSSSKSPQKEKKQKQGDFAATGSEINPPLPATSSAAASPLGGPGESAENNERNNELQLLDSSSLVVEPVTRETEEEVEKENGQMDTPEEDNLKRDEIVTSLASPLPPPLESTVNSTPPSPLLSPTRSSIREMELEIEKGEELLERIREKVRTAKRKSSTEVKDEENVAPGPDPEPKEEDKSDVVRKSSRVAQQESYLEAARRKRAEAAERARLRDGKGKGLEANAGATDAEISAALLVVDSPPHLPSVSFPSVSSPVHSPRSPKTATVAAGQVQKNSEKPHDFRKVRKSRGERQEEEEAAPTCACCGGMWEEEEEFRRFYQCFTCRAVVHSDCRSFYQRCVATCSSEGGEGGAIGVKWASVNQQGEVCVVVQQAIQFPLSAGDSVYAKLRLKPWREEVRTSSAVWGDMGAIWVSSIREPLGSLKETLSLVHIYNSKQTPLPILRVEIWRKRVVGLGDEMLGRVEMNAAPLLLYPATVAQRWLQIRSEGPPDDLPGSGNPMVLISMQFNALAARRPLSKKHSRSASSGSFLGFPTTPRNLSKKRSGASLLPDDDNMPATWGATRGGGSTRHDNNKNRMWDTDSETAVELDVVADLDEFSLASFSEERKEGEGGAGAEGEEQGMGLLHSPGMEVERPEISELGSREEGGGQHLFRRRNNLAPVWCGFCGGVVVAFAHQCFECEACGMSVHKRCQLKANFMTACSGTSAPGQVDLQWKVVQGLSETRDKEHDKEGDMARAGGAGLLLVEFQSVHICARGCGDWGHDTTSHRAEGDHYLRLHVGDTKNLRTPTVFQSSEPEFGNSFTLQVKAHDAPIVVELVEAVQDTVVGRHTTAPIDILQRDYDAIMERKQPLPSDLFQKLPLYDDGSSESSVRGLLTVRFAFEEDLDGFLYCKNPRAVPPSWNSSTNESLSVESLRRTLSRISSIIAWHKPVIAGISHVLSWEDMPLSGLCFILFVYMTIFASAEHILALIPLALLVHMTIALGARRSGRFVTWWVERNFESSGKQQLIKKQFRPLAKVRMAVVRGQNIISRELGLPGNAYVRMSYHHGHHRYGEREGSSSLIGVTATYKPASASPDWSRLAPRPHEGTDILLQNFPEVWGEDIALKYPILQPLQPLVREGGEGGGGGEIKEEQELVLWKDASGFLRFEICLANPFNSSMDTSLGEVRVAVSSLVSSSGAAGGAQAEVRGWYPIQGSEVNPDAAIYLRLQLLLRKHGDPVTEEEIGESEAAEVLLEEVFQYDQNSPIPGKEVESEEPGQGRRGNEGGSNPLATFLHIRSTVEDILRTVNGILDTLERLKNLLNWSQPPKTWIVYVGLILSWAFLLLVPTRYIVFAIGMAAFGSGYSAKKRRMRKKEQGQELVQDQVSEKPKKKMETDPPGSSSSSSLVAAYASSLPLRLSNLLLSIPSDLDLKRAFSERSKDFQKNVLNSKLEKRQRARAQALGKSFCQWKGTMRWCPPGSVTAHSWRQKFVVLQGHRLAWWSSAPALEEGSPAEGQLFLQGHAGVTGASPVECRLVSDPSRLLCAFGRGPDGAPMRCLFQANSPSDKERLEGAIIRAMDTKFE